LLQEKYFIGPATFWPASVSYCYYTLFKMETIIAENTVSSTPKGKIALKGKIFNYKTAQLKTPHNWLDLKITNEKGDLIEVFFNPKRADILREVKKQVRLYGWVR
jgi:hypothetical protein